MNKFTQIRKAVFPVAGLGTRFLPATKMRAYLIPGEQHTLLGKMAETTVQNVVLEGWLAGMLDDQTTWTTVQP